MKTEEPRYVCHVCIGDQVLTKQVEEENTPAECSYCQLTKPALTLAGLSNRIRQVLEEHFIPVPENDDPEQSRQGLKDIEAVIEAVAHLEQGIAADVREYLFNRLACTVNVAGGEENPYSHGMLYEEREADTSDLRSAWWTLDEAIRSRARFFGATTVDILDKIFENLDSLRTIGNKSVIREIKPNETDSTFWRARTALSAWEIKPILESLSSQLGPPPSDKATAGRMNAEGIPVFYGALEEQTCVSEVRAPVGSYVVLVKFDLLNPISVLDLTELSNLYSDVSHFDPNYIERRSWASFLEQLAGEMSRPVMPHQEAQEYIPTQIVSEYLANKFKPRLHGIIFNSAQTGSGGHNIVLFNGACSVEPYEPPPGTSIGFRVTMPLQPRIPPPGTEWSQSWVIQTEPQRAVGETERSVEDHTTSDPETQASHGDSTLRLDPQSLKVVEISGVKYDPKPLTLNRDHNVSAGAVNFRFDLPTPEVTLSTKDHGQSKDTE